MPLKGGNLFIEDVRISPSGPFRPGDPVFIEVDVGNGALAIGLDDPDACSSPQTLCEPPGFLETRGYCAGVGFSFGGTLHEEEACIQIALSGAGVHTFEHSFVVPSSPGSHDITITLFASGSGESESTTRSITVEAPPGDGDDDGGNGGDGNGDGEETILGLTQTQAMVAGGAGLVALGLLIAGTPDDE